MTDSSQTTVVSAERRAQVLASNRKFGRVLSTIGAALAAVAVAGVIVGGLVFAATDAVIDGTADGIRGFASLSMTAIPGVLGLFAMCGLVAGEQMRRGSIRRNPDTGDAMHPAPSHVSSFALLPIGWHVLWIAVGCVVVAVLAGIPIGSWFTGGWPSGRVERMDFTGFWILYGSIASGITVAAVVSLIKKLAWLRRVRSGTLASRPSRFWRWVDYRWRFDLWLAGAGGFIGTLALTQLQGAVGPEASAERLAQATPAMLQFLVIAAVLVVGGIVCALQFWRSGEELGSGESAA